MAGGLASGRGYSPMLPMTLGGDDLRTMSWMKLNDLYKAEEEEAWVNGFSKMVNAMYAKDTGEYAMCAKDTGEICHGMYAK